MAGLSNFLGYRDDQADSLPVQCRLVQRHEIEPALRVMLAGGINSSASDEQVLDFLGFALERQIDVNELWIAANGSGRIVWSLLPVVSPGRTMLMFSPGKLPRGTPDGAIQALVDTVAREYLARGVHLAQLLIDPADKSVIRAYLACGFQQLAELLYLQRRTAPADQQIPLDLPAGFTLHAYTPKLHAQFAEAIGRSYASSLDCPALNGLRNMEDVIAGHKATGDFDPELWFLLTDNSTGDAAGTLLLSRTTQGDAVELVYLGLSPQFRGRGAGDALMRLALAKTAAQGRWQLALAVDSRNQPALRLYYRHGMHRVGARIALIKDLRAAGGLATQGSEADPKPQAVQEA
jgi:ribosomal protein S18 acetylase RimI-like enzyme